MHLVLGWEIAGPVELQVDQILGGKNLWKRWVFINLKSKHDFDTYLPDIHIFQILENNDGRSNLCFYDFQIILLNK